MTSVVDTSVKHAHSAMVNAMVLNGVAGSGIALLDAFLVSGWETKSATSLSVSGGVATLAFAGTHSATVDSVILVAGSSIAALNGEQKITEVGSGLVKFATVAADSAATGAISFKMAPAGWTIAFTGTNLRAYKSPAVAGYGMYLRVDDTTTYQMRVIGYEQMTDINTGVGAFPTPAMVTGGGLWAKSWSANTTAVPWTLFADDRMFYIGIAGNYATGPTYVGQVVRGFGDMISRRPGGDPYACVLNCHTAAVAIPAAAASQGSFSNGVVAGNCFLPRDYTGLGSAITATAYPVSGTPGQASGLDTRFGAFPGPFGELALSPKNVATSATSSPRANLPGIYHIPHSAVFDTYKTGDLVNGTGALAGRRLMTVNVTESQSANTSNNVGVVAFDITGPWGR